MKKNKIKISIYISIIIVCGFLILSKTWIFFNGKGYKPIEIVPYEKAYIGSDEIEINNKFKWIYNRNTI